MVPVFERAGAQTRPARKRIGNQTRGDPLAEVLMHADRQMYREKLSRLGRPLEE